MAQCSEAVVNHNGVTFACPGASLEKVNTKEALSSAEQRKGERLNEKGAHTRLRR